MEGKKLVWKEKKTKRRSLDSELSDEMTQQTNLPAESVKGKKTKKGMTEWYPK